MSEALMRKEYLTSKNNKMISCNDAEYYKDTIQSIKQVCEKMCKADCNTKYYRNVIEIEDGDYGSFRLYHGEYPNILIEHIPEITLIEFFAFAVFEDC